MQNAEFKMKNEELMWRFARVRCNSGTFMERFREGFVFILHSSILNSAFIPRSAQKRGCWMNAECRIQNEELRIDVALRASPLQFRVPLWKGSERQAMAVEHVILRKPAVAARRFGATGSAAAEAASPLIVEIGDLSRAKAAALRRKKDIAGVARSIPMKLIAPVARHSSAGEAADSVVTWGVRAVGADTSPYDGDGVIVAILDSGIDRSHPAFQGV